MKGNNMSSHHNGQKHSSRAARGERRQHSVFHGLVPVLTASFIIVLCWTVFGSFLSSAHGNLKEEPVNFKYYKSITIEKGDTLWDIAEEYITDDYDSVEEYVYILKEMNNLTSDKILAGQKLVIAYNDTIFNP